jgi:hypothetical protein
MLDPAECAMAEKFLDRVGELVEQGWCQHVLARNADGESVSPHSVTRVEVCLNGAIEVAYRELNLPGVSAFVGVRAIQWASGHAGIAKWNDEAWRTVEDCVGMLQTAKRGLRSGAIERPLYA